MLTGHQVNLLAGSENSKEQFAHNVSVDRVRVDVAPEFAQVSTLRVEEQVAVGGFAVTTSTAHLLNKPLE